MTTLRTSAILILVLVAVVAEAGILPTIGSIQSAAAKGRLLCKGKPYKGAKVKLWDIDTTDPDDLMGETQTDKDGYFVVKGNETEVTTIDPKINIYHNCEDENVECLRKIQIILPTDFVTQGEHPAKTFDAGVLNLSGKFPGESRDCIN
ncbi:transthyretin-like family domain-containing protein [Ditylenchus destructor]|uniref:Transthyretin-like family domain-containing protein n=1 Tax=Ditylenchus destructor TaxID=166010 RepID=A0AAD4R746_9BILA|nr:transthyretin-like family domain-containing protein [Ditylenchus destructor]